MKFDHLPTLHDIENLKGKKVILRMSLNVPVANMKVVDDSRIIAGLPTVEFLRNAGAKVIIIGHIGREKSESLLHVAEHMEKFFHLTFVENILGADAANTVDDMKEGDVVMFENIRRYDEEVNNNDGFAQNIAHLGDIYVNDAFPVAHRKHASVVGIPKYLPSYFGFRFVEEVNQLSKAFDPKHPFVFILGGAKVETKLPLLEKFIKKADKVFIGGVLANDFFNAKGIEVGRSVISDQIAPLGLANDPKMMLSDDVVVLRDTRSVVVGIDSVKPDDFIYDVGPESVKRLGNEISKASFILWNGPLGYCEKGFCDGTRDVAKAIIESDAESIIGGGDTIASLSDEDSSKFNFVSIAGGAMLDFLANETLPAIDAVVGSN